MGWNRNQRNVSVAKKISATESQETGFKEKLIQIKELSIFNF